MNSRTMTSLERVLTALGQREPDRVPFFLMVTMHGARELGLTIKEYFSRPEYVVEGQLRMRAKYGHDCVYGLFYAAAEYEAWGGEVVYFDDGPPNSGMPIIARREDILRLEPPAVNQTPCLLKTLKAIEALKERAGGEAPVVGVVVAPFSLPVMQMGFDKYIELIYEEPELFDRLMKVNEEFCVEWANAQFRAGATAIGYFDPVSSPSITPRDIFLKGGFEISRRVIARVKGPMAIHLGSERCLPIIDDIAQTGSVIVGGSALEDLGMLKAACRGRLTVLGNLNGIEMRRWTPQQAEAAVKDAIAKAGPGGGFILCDNHGEIPWQVPEPVLMAVRQAVEKWGRYPLAWVNGHGEKALSAGLQ
ncbi:MAG: uroporphyrinogen decarboxylase family protein [Chloroflexi bacterium]|nr:uroporphyrinogen decarboxylase family protein [Chloroflexota bacterium]